MSASQDDAYITWCRENAENWRPAWDHALELLRKDYDQDTYDFHKTLGLAHAGDVFRPPLKGTAIDAEYIETALTAYDPSVYTKVIDSYAQRMSSLTLEAVNCPCCHTTEDLPPAC